MFDDRDLELHRPEVFGDVLRGEGFAGFGWVARSVLVKCGQMVWPDDASIAYTNLSMIFSIHRRGTSSEHLHRRYRAESLYSNPRGWSLALN